MAGSLAPVIYWTVRTTLGSVCGAFAVPSGDAASRDALDGAAVEMFEDQWAHAKFFQPPEGEEALLCPLHICAGGCGPS